MNSSSYTQLIKQRPFGWVFDDPPKVEAFEFEYIDPFYWHDVIEQNWKLAFYVGAIYVVSIFSLQAYMSNRPAYDLKGPLFVWNLSLGIFSAIGFLRSAPGLIYVLSQPNGFYNSICVKEGIDVPSVYWALLFALSKFWELGDTVFIVLRKRPLVLLQWYHHLVTLTVVWIVAPLVEPISRWYAILNYGVHMLMYNYFALKALGIRVPTGIANLITTLQLGQMIVGFSVNMMSLYFLQTDHGCTRYPISIKAFNFVYGSFILLFGKLFYESVMKAERKLKAKKV